MDLQKLLQQTRHFQAIFSSSFPQLFKVRVYGPTYSYLCICLLERQSYTEKTRESFHLQVPSPMGAVSRTDQSQGQKLSGLLCEWQSPKHLGPPLLPSPAHEEAARPEAVRM